MKRFILAVFAVVSLGGCQSVAKQQTPSGPVALLQRIYTLPVPNFDAFYDRELRHVFYTQDIIEDIEQAEHCFKETFGLDDLDFNYIVPGNEYNLSNLQMAELGNDGRTARIEVRFKNGEEKVLLDFYLENQNGQWLIGDVAPGDGRLSSSVKLACN